MLLIVKYVILSDQSETTSIESAEIGGSFGTTVNLVSLGRGIAEFTPAAGCGPCIPHPTMKRAKPFACIDAKMCFTSHLFSFQSL